MLLPGLLPSQLLVLVINVISGPAHCPSDLFPCLPPLPHKLNQHSLILLAPAAFPDSPAETSLDKPAAHPDRPVRNHFGDKLEKIGVPENSVDDVLLVQNDKEVVIGCVEVDLQMLLMAMYYPTASVMAFCS